MTGMTNRGAVATWLQRSESDCVADHDRWLLLDLPAGAIPATAPQEMQFCGTCVMPGAFNPLHDAHRKMAELARQKTGRPVFFELAINNVDKSSLYLEELQARVSQDFQPCGLVISRCGSFAEKSDIFQGTTFIVGADTIRRIGDVKYYNDNPQDRDAAIARIASNQCGFLVFGRKIGNIFAHAQNTCLCTELSDITVFVDRREFEMEISSTKIRRSTS